MQPLDSTDRRILLALSSAVRRSASSIAGLLGLGRNTVQTRLSRLESEVLDGMDRRIPPAALGFGLLSFVELHVDQRHLETITQSLAEIPEVLEAHGLTGSADILVRVAAANAEELFRVHGRLLHIHGVQRADSALSMAELIPYRTTRLIEMSLGSKSPGD
ncbi:Lrp/AsnC family transcriptional regulator [Glutamicibacter sp. MNS18]|uniref:Lrp/AsnC family transcriptional regulator n=1 Tax=Glutamicibacter sp. MNS18 TaxID=2989817 RepID=UPI002235D2EB|nr:Lrp/AsnC family transcriptional regulator [Glutamicibacter sp. MNS18]MCW4465221.1 Lrp/AsnC family transcriptional regulator [Glutamicibacter sp. MNS18]